MDGDVVCKSKVGFGAERGRKEFAKDDGWDVVEWNGMEDRSCERGVVSARTICRQGSWKGKGKKCEWWKW